jgi:hypothetical protein
MIIGRMRSGKGERLIKGPADVYMVRPFSLAGLIPSWHITTALLAMLRFDSGYWHLYGHQMDPGGQS